MRAFRAVLVFVVVLIACDVMGVRGEHSFPLALLCTILSTLLPTE